MCYKNVCIHVIVHSHACMLACVNMEARVTGGFLSLSTIVTEPGAHSSTL